MTPAERAQHHADTARNRVDSTYIARERWTVTIPNAEPMLVIFCPPQTQAEVLARWYPGAGVSPC